MTSFLIGIPPSIEARLKPVLRFLGLVVAAMALEGSLALHAQDLVPATPIGEVLKLGSEAAARKVPARLRGVVTYPNSRRVHFYLEDKSGGIVVQLTNTALCPEFSQEVEVDGVTGGSGTQVWVDANAVRVIGPGVLPEPRRALLSDVTAVRHFARWVEVEGVVLQVRVSDSGGVGLHLGGEDGWAVVQITEALPTSVMARIMGARVKMQGVNTGPSSSAVLARKSNLLAVVSLGFNEPFAAPMTNAGSLFGVGHISPDRVKLHATVLEVARDGWVFLRSGHTAFQADFLYPFDINDRTWKPIAPVPIPKMERGDVVEVVGLPVGDGAPFSLRYCQFRVLHSDDEPAALQTNLAAVISGKVANDFVNVQGRFLDHSRFVLSGRGYEVIKLQDGKAVLDVVLESSKTNQLASLQAGDRVEARGIVRFHDGTPLYRLHLRSGADVRTLGVDPQLVQQGRLRWGGILVLIILAGLAWILFLRNKLERERRLVAERTQVETTIRELNVRLEQRVAERTAELEKTKEDLREALEVERELNELKSRFVSLVSHEFRTPLGITMSAVELLRNYMDRLAKEKQKVLLDDIYSSTLRMASLMEQVLLLGRVEAGKSGFNPKSVDLEALGEKLVDEMLSATNRKCRVQLKAAGHLQNASGDEGLLRHIFSNLLSNAVKYSPPEETVAFELSREGEFAVFLVRDRGIGIPVPDQARLFEAFHRASNVGETPGTGLGLLIVKRCVEMHQGTISLESQPGQGTAFTVRLPLFSPVAAKTPA